MLEERGDVLAALAVVGFHDRYYQLCATHHFQQAPKPKYTAAAVRRILASLGRTPIAEQAGRAFEFASPLDDERWLSTGLIIQGRSEVEFWWSLNSPTGPVGDTMAVTARAVAMHAGRPSPDPPYPRPEFDSLEGLEEILRIQFDLAETAGRAVP